MHLMEMQCGSLKASNHNARQNHKPLPLSHLVILASHNMRNLLDDWERQALEKFVILAVIDQNHHIVVVPVFNVLLKHLVNHLVSGMLYQLEHPAFDNGRKFLPANRQ